MQGVSSFQSFPPGIREATIWAGRGIADPRPPKERRRDMGTTNDMSGGESPKPARRDEGSSGIGIVFVCYAVSRGAAAILSERSESFWAAHPDQAELSLLSAQLWGGLASGCALLCCLVGSLWLRGRGSSRWKWGLALAASLFVTGISDAVSILWQTSGRIAPDALVALANRVGPHHPPWETIVAIIQIGLLCCVLLWIDRYSRGSQMEPGPL
jgi:hypothetical protein